MMLNRIYAMDLFGVCGVMHCLWRDASVGFWLNLQSVEARLEWIQWMHARDRPSRKCHVLLSVDQ